MNILHISNGYADSKVHSNLTNALDALGVEQTVYCPVREKRLIGNNRFDGEHIHFVYSFCIRPWYKYVYQYKRWRVYRDMKKRINLGQFDVIHASTLFSDGGLAIKAHEDFGIPYVVAVRNTDINTYIKRLKHTHSIGRKILLGASRIIFISKGEMEEFCLSEMVTQILDKIRDKIAFQPNGIDDYWHQHICHVRRTGHDVLYVGDFSRNKNVVRLAESVQKLRQEKGFEDVHLIVVGGEKRGKAWKSDDNTQQIIDKHPEFIRALGKIFDREKLAEVMRSCCIFAMPSIHETFGLVYIEALSQNLPVIFTKGQGIDGILDKSVGIGVDALSIDSIRDAIKELLINHQNYGNRNVDFSLFDWNNIAKAYIELYKEIKSNVSGKDM